MSRWTRSWRAFDCNGPIKAVRCNLEHVRRRARKKLGLPITRDSAILSTFVKKVRCVIEEELGSQISTIAPAAPQLVGWDSEDFQDALESAGLVSARKNDGHSNERSTYWDTNAAYAALGHGLCQSWADPTRCVVEERQMPYEHVLFLDFDNSSFSATVQYMQHSDQEWTYSNSVDARLGWWRLPVYEVSRGRFWEHIYEVILEVAGALQRAPNKVVLLGDHGSNAAFLDIVKAALWEVLEIDVSLMLSANKAEDVGMLAARGAAEFARRAEVWKKWEVAHEDIESIEL